MKRSNKSELNFYVDSIIIETILKDEKFIKQAEGSLVTSLIDKVKNYVSNNIDSNDKVGSLMNILGPGAISVAFSSMGLSWLGILIGLSMRVFNIDVKSIISSIWDKLKNVTSGDKQISSSQIDSFVQDAVKSHYKPATLEEAESVKTIETKSFSQLIRDARIIKLTMINYDEEVFRKEAGFFEIFNDRKSKTASILIRVLSWIFKIAFASAGLLVAGDVINKFLGRPNAIDGTNFDKKNKSLESDKPINVSKQKKYHVKSGYVVEKYNLGESNWTENILNNPTAIEKMLIDFTHDVYDGLNNKDNLIINSPSFKVVKDRIVWYNHTSLGSPIIWIPKYFSSKKQIVDYFIDDVAERDV